MPVSWIPTILRPEICWPLRKPTPPSSNIPPTPHAASPLMRRFWGWLHYYRRHYSQYYSKWVGIPWENQIIQLPFGLVLKWSDCTRLEEVLAMQVARAAGLPVPKVICYGDHPDSPHAPVSILMRRVPGRELGLVYEELDNGSKEAIRGRMKKHLDCIRRWSNPWSDTLICSVNGTAIRSVRVPMHYAGPCENEQEFTRYLISAAWEGGFESNDTFVEAMSRAQAIQRKPHKIVFTHGDFKMHNIMVDGGHVTGFWFGNRQDGTLNTGIHYSPQTIRKDFWWYTFVSEFGGDKYLEEQECEKSLTHLTSGSYYW